MECLHFFLVDKYLSFALRVVMIYIIHDLEHENGLLSHHTSDSLLEFKQIQ